MQRPCPVGRPALLCLVGLIATATAGSAAPIPAWVGTHPVQQQAEHALAALPGGVAWAVLENNRIAKTTDFGHTWTPVTLVTAPVPGVPLPYSGPVIGGTSRTFVAPQSETSAYGANGTALSRTTDGGVSWSRVAAPSVTSSEVFEYAEGLERTGGALWYARTGSEVVGLCAYVLPTTPLLVSTDGVRWRRTDIPHAGGKVDEVRFADARRGVALVSEFSYSATVEEDHSCGYSGTSVSGGVYATSDGGRTWRRALTCRPRCTSVAWAGGQRVVVGRSDGEIFTSNDGGRRFADAGSVASSDTTLDGLDCVGARCFASLNGTGIFRSDDAGAAWVEETSLHVAYFPGSGDLAAFDAEHAVAIGPSSILARERTPVAMAPVVGRAHEQRPTPSRVELGPGTWRDLDGTIRRDVRLARPARGSRADA